MNTNIKLFKRKRNVKLKNNKFFIRLDKATLNEKINKLEMTNKKILEEIQLYDCCSLSFMKEINYLKYKLDINNINY